MAVNQKVLPDAILQALLNTGMVIVGGKRTGKSNSGKVISSEIIRRKSLPLPVQIKIFDTASNWRWNYESILCQRIDERVRHFYDGVEHILFDIRLIDELETFKFIEKVLLTDYIQQANRKELLGGHNDKWILYVIEEAQNLLGSFSLMRKEGRRVLKMLSEGRNFGLSYVLIGQRLSEISSRAIERCRGYLFGRLVGDNDVNKLKRIVGRKSLIVDEVRKLGIGKGEFLYYDGSSTYDFNCPKYDSRGQKPVMWTPNVEDIPIWRFRSGRRII